MKNKTKKVYISFTQREGAQNMFSTKMKKKIENLLNITGKNLKKKSK